VYFLNAGGGRKSLKVLKFEVLSIFCMFLPYFFLNYICMLKNESRSKEKLRKISVLGIKFIGPRPLGGRAPGASPGSASVLLGVGHA